MNIKIFGVYLADFKKNIGGEINNSRYCIAISEVSSKDNTLLVVPITGKKSGKKYRGGFTIDNTKYQTSPKYEKCFAKVRKIREIDKSRITGTEIFELDEYDQQQLRDTLQKVIKIDLCKNNVTEDPTMKDWDWNVETTFTIEEVKKELGLD